MDNKLQLLIETGLDYAVYHTEDNKSKEVHFNSVDAFIRYSTDAKHCESYNRKDDWTYNTTGSQVAAMVLNRAAKHELLKMIDHSIELDDINLTTTTTAPTLAYDESGIFCDVNAYLAGEEDCMLNLIDKPQQSKTIWIASDIMSWGAVSAKTMVNRGVALMRAVKTLQALNYSVGLMAYIHGDNNNTKVLASIVVKRPDEPLNESLLVTTFCHPAFFRAVGHNCIAKLNKRNGNSGSMNPVNTDSATFKRSYADHTELHVLKCSFDYDDAGTPQIAENWIKQELNKIATKQDQQQYAA